MQLGKVQVNRGLLQIAMAEQNLNRAQIRSVFEQVRREAVPQRVRMNIIPESRSLCCLPASMPDYLGVDRPLSGVPAITWKQPDFRPTP